MVPMALALMAGIVASHLLPALPPLVWLMLAAAAMLTGGLLTFFSKRGSTVLPFLALTLLFLSLGALRYQLSDYPVKILPFHTSGETLRMNLLERMQEGPLEHRYAGIAEALTNDKGWIINSLSPLQLANTLTTFVSTPFEERQKRIINARKLIENDFDARKLARIRAKLFIDGKL